MRTGLSKKLGIKRLRKQLKISANLRYRSIRASLRRSNQRAVGDFSVSLTSYPERFDLLPITIKSLLEQTIQPKIITLYLSREEVGNEPIPDRIARFQSDRFRISIVENNYKPYNKIIHALRENPNDKILTVDDDRHYPCDLFESIYTESLKYPNTIICSIGRYICTDQAGKLAPYCKWTTKYTHDRTAILPLGYGGVLYTPGCFHADVGRAEVFMNLAPTTDDLWLKVMSFMKGTPIRSLRRPMKDCFETRIEPKTSLWAYNKLGADDHNILRLLAFYRIDARNFAEEPPTYE